MTAPTDQPRQVGWHAFRHETEVARAFDRVRSYLSADPRRLLGDGAAGMPDGEIGRTGLHLHRAGLDLSRPVRVLMGDLEVGSRLVRIPISWADAQRPNLFPALEGTLQIIPATNQGPATTHIDLAGRYVPPFGRLGGVANAVAGRHLVQESVERFLAALTERLERELPPDPVAARTAGELDLRRLP